MKLKELGLVTSLITLFCKCLGQKAGSIEDNVFTVDYGTPKASVDVTAPVYLKQQPHDLQIAGEIYTNPKGYTRPSFLDKPSELTHKYGKTDIQMESGLVQPQDTLPISAITAQKYVAFPSHEIDVIVKPLEDHVITPPEIHIETVKNEKPALVVPGTPLVTTTNLESKAQVQKVNHQATSVIDIAPAVDTSNHTGTVDPGKMESDQLQQTSVNISAETTRLDKERFLIKGPLTASSKDTSTYINNDKSNVDIAGQNSSEIVFTPKQNDVSQYGKKQSEILPLVESLKETVKSNGIQITPDKMHMTFALEPEPKSLLGSLFNTQEKSVSGKTLKIRVNKTVDSVKQGDNVGNGMDPATDASFEPMKSEHTLLGSIGKVEKKLPTPKFEDSILHSDLLPKEATLIDSLHNIPIVKDGADKKVPVTNVQPEVMSNKATLIGSLENNPVVRNGVAKDVQSDTLPVPKSTLIETLFDVSANTSDSAILDVNHTLEKLPQEEKTLLGSLMKIPVEAKVSHENTVQTGISKTATTLIGSLKNIPVVAEKRTKNGTSLKTLPEPKENLIETLDDVRRQLPNAREADIQLKKDGLIPESSSSLLNIMFDTYNKVGDKKSEQKSLPAPATDKFEEYVIGPDGRVNLPQPSIMDAFLAMHKMLRMEQYKFGEHIGQTMKQTDLQKYVIGEDGSVSLRESPSLVEAFNGLGDVLAMERYKMDHAANSADGWYDAYLREFGGPTTPVL